MGSKDIFYDAPGKFQDTRFERIHNVTFPSAAEASRLVAEEIATGIRSSIKKPYILGLATGSSPIGVYKELVSLHKKEGLSFKNVITFNLDEYFPIEKNDLLSYNHFMNYHLFDHIDIPKENINIPKGNISSKNIYSYCNEYEKKINDLGGLDFQLLGIGRTGHIGFNEPGSNKNSVTRLVSLDFITKEDAAGDFNGIDNVPDKAITMGVDTIMKAKRIVLLAWGHKKSEKVAKSIEGPISSMVPASFLQAHSNTSIILDEEASSELTRYKTPWLVKDCKWNDNLRKKAIAWLCNKLQKPILKLTQRDYNENGLSDLLETEGSGYELNIWMFNQLQRSITGWPGGKPNHSDENRPERALPTKKRVLVFSPHPDDDVISMGGTLARLINQNHEVYVAYQTSGNIAVSDEDARRYVDVSIATSGDSKKMNSLKLELTNKKEGTIDSNELNKLKGDIRKSECFAAARVLNLEENRLHFLNLPFYQTRKVEKKDPSQKDINIVKGLIEELKPHQIFAAGDLADPHGTHKICLDILFEAISELKNKSFMKDCWLWLYRGAWQEWDINEIDMAVPMSPEQVIQKRNSILSHQSQKDKVMYQGQDKRDFWLRAEERNRNTAITFNKLGLTEYQAIEAFKRHKF